MSRRLWVNKQHPTHCPRGHVLVYPNIDVTVLPCACTPTRGGVHQWIECRTCNAVTCWPPHTPDPKVWELVE